MPFASIFEWGSTIVGTPGSATQLTLISFVAFGIWCLALCVYRLFLHPLAQFPGDKLAAVTGWVETYHDVFRGGQFIFKLEEWHAKYGPIVRISPFEVHIADPDFVDVIYASNSRFDKKMEWKYRFGIPHSTFDTIEHEHHRVRRSAIAPFFSKQKIASITDYISSKAQRLCDRLETEYKNQAGPVNLNQCLTALTFDITTYYAFASSLEYLERPGFDTPFTSAAKGLATTLHTMGHFPLLLAFLQSLPRSLSVAMNPRMGDIFAFHDGIEDEIKAIKSGVNNAHKDVAHKTLTTQAGASVVGAAVETTTAALSKACFFILDNPRIKAKLTAELASVFPDPRTTPPLASLEALPYLSAVVSETLRMTIGVSSRTIRKSRAGPVPYGGRLIPEGYYFGMTTYFTHKDPAIWDAPLEFRPERWLEGAMSPLAPNGQPLGKYLVTFGRGPRMCLGMNLARAELFIGLAVLFRRCDWELFETTREAVDMKADYFVPLPSPTTKGVRVLVK
ncbi:cytochrome protein [Xylariaceae sp. AK1471]|nr:cytochrome protein [Xylariaceae sp. AK1471]